MGVTGVIQSGIAVLSNQYNGAYSYVEKNIVNTPFRRGIVRVGAGTLALYMFTPNYLRAYALDSVRQCAQARMPDMYQACTYYGAHLLSMSTETAKNVAYTAAGLWLGKKALGVGNNAAPKHVSTDTTREKKTV